LSLIPRISQLKNLEFAAAVTSMRSTRQSPAFSRSSKTWATPGVPGILHLVIVTLR
jgi:hypothetical protein